MTKEIPRQKPVEQPPLERINNFNEVSEGFSKETAMAEAERCIQCKKPHCIKGCPVNVDIPGFISAIVDGDFSRSFQILQNTNSLPAICGRVCPQESQCEMYCVLGNKYEPVAIGALERFVADHQRNAGNTDIPVIRDQKEKKVAVIGSGPAGLTVAGDLRKKGYPVTIFEALHSPGGVLVYGIPEFRLPKNVVEYEINALSKLGVDMVLNRAIGMSETIDDMLGNGYDAVFVGSGAGLPLFLNIPGENLTGVYTANEYLTRANLMKAYRFPEYSTPIIRGKNIAVFGGGNVAMDAARTAKRLGGENVYIIYRRTMNELPARLDEVHHAEEEGIIFKLLSNPTRFIGNEQGHLESVECLKMELGLPDESGRRRPVPIDNSEFNIPVDLAIIAIGNAPNPIIQKSTADLETTRWGTIVADDETMKTSREGVFAGGDIVTGAATVIEAMGAGRKAAMAMDDYLITGQW